MSKLAEVAHLPEGKKLPDVSLKKGCDLMDYSERVLYDDNFWGSLPEVIPTIIEDYSLDKMELRDELKGLIRESRQTLSQLIAERRALLEKDGWTSLGDGMIVNLPKGFPEGSLITVVDVGRDGWGKFLDYPKEGEPKIFFKKNIVTSPDNLDIPLHPDARAISYYIRHNGEWQDHYPVPHNW